MTEKQRKLADYTRQLIGSSSVVGKEAVRELPGAQLEAASGALESVLNDRELHPRQQFFLEAIVLPKLRPVSFIKEDSFADLPDPWASLNAFKAELSPVIRAIGRVEVDNAGVPFGGTGWLCGKDLILTNRHVAELFTYGVGGASRLRFIPRRDARLETAHEHPLKNEAGLTYRVKGAVLVHPHWDLAVLNVEIFGDPALAPKPLELCATALDSAVFPDTDVAVIGYPYWSDLHDPEIMREVFNGVYSVKRIQPGKLMRYENVDSYRRTVNALLHDASTLGGNSGSAVVSLESQQVLALHFAGTYLVANYSVPMWELAQDPRLVDAGLNFVPAPSATLPRTPGDGGPAWLDAWRGRENAPPAVAAPQPPPPPAGFARESLSSLSLALIDPGWIERFTDEEIRRFYQRDPEQFRALLSATMSDEEAQELYDSLLLDASVESVRERAADPSLPEIVLVPGILGSHLEGAGGRGRAWLNPLILPYTNLLRALGLNANGNDPNSLRPDGYLRFAYAKAARAWRKQGFMVHEFSYDWRVPLAASARRLGEFLCWRRRDRPEARFALVCHSRGGLVASIYGRDTPDWRDYVEQAIFCGTPLGGSFAIMEILTGEFAFVQKLAAVSLATSVEEMQTMGASFPGALEMLPHPALFSTAAADVEYLYNRSAYASFAQPGADWLRAARRIKDDLRNSPILGRTTCFISADLCTSGTFENGSDGTVRRSENQVRGDGTVPAASAFVPGVPSRAADFEHSELLKDPVIIEGVPLLLRKERAPFAEVTQETVGAPLAASSSPPSLETLIAKWKAEAIAVRERMRNGISTTADLAWLLSTR